MRAIATFLLASALAGPATAETLQGALVKAYNANPTISAARAQQRGNDENVVIQRAAGLPSLTANSEFGENVLVPPGQQATIGRSISNSLQLSVPIYQGGLVRNNVRAANQRVLAGQETLRATEGSVFSQVVAAYNDVIRDQSIVELNGQSYFIYHNGALAADNGSFRRSVCVDYLYYNADGTIRRVVQTSEGTSVPPEGATTQPSTK